MDDSLKLQKLAAGRKKLKSHQKRKNKAPKGGDGEDNNNQNVEQTIQPEYEIKCEREEETCERNELSELQTYFTQNVDVPAPSFFDNLNQPKSLEVECSENHEKSEEIAVKQEKTEEIHGSSIDMDSTSEIIKELTTQIQQVVDEQATNISDHHQNTKLILQEKQQIDFKSLFEREKTRNVELSKELDATRAIQYDLESKLNKTQLDFDSRLQEELTSLQTQLQTHIQTIGILVSEKTELTAALNHSELINKQKLSECDELQARLKTSRSRVVNLEKALVLIKNEHAACSNLVLESHKLNEQLKRFEEDASVAAEDSCELNEKVKQLTSENNALTLNRNELKSQLDLFEIKLQQLSALDGNGDLSKMDCLMQEKLAVEKELNDVRVRLESVLNEKNQANGQYQQYVQQLSANVNILAEKLEVALKDNQNLMKREDDFVRHIGELEKRLQTLQNQHLENERIAHADYVDDDMKMKFDVLQEQCDDLVCERDDLLKEVDAKKETISNLELDLEKLRFHQADSGQLLATIESDKVAASRAVEQNRLLKVQLEEMEKAYIKMTNDKAELTDKLISEEFRLKESEEQRLQFQQQLHMMADAIAIKDNELTDIRGKFDALKTKEIQHDQLNDRLRHYEAVEMSSEVLKHQHHHQPNQHYELRIRELEENLEKLRLENQQIGNKSSEAKGMNETSECVVVHENGESLINKDSAMQQLESKFLKTMEEMADLQDEKQFLEHLVMQLQSETETIGEYVALYQHQRGVLKQRANEKEQQLKQLADDRLLVRNQLNLLNELVERLMRERGVDVKDLNLMQETSALCREHKMNGSDNGGDDNNKETAEQIIALLTEIKSSNLVQPSNAHETAFHACPQCSGQLITV